VLFCKDWQQDGSALGSDGAAARIGQDHGRIAIQQEKDCLGALQVCWITTALERAS
jgi:hypothetical protein